MQGVLYLFSLLIKKEEMKMRHDQEREKKKTNFSFRQNRIMVARSFFPEITATKKKRNSNEIIIKFLPFCFSFLPQ